MPQTNYISKEKEPAPKKSDLFLNLSPVVESLSPFERLQRYIGNQGMQSGKKPISQAEIDTAEAIYWGLKKVLDDRGWEIFERWLNGAGGEAIFQNETWKQYMVAEKQLEQTILNQLQAHAEMISSQMGRGCDAIDGNLKLQFHAEVGSKHGGYRTGYELLHGTNNSAGDFQVFGDFQIHKSGIPPGSKIVVFKNLQFIFNDIVDPKKTYPMDISTERLTRNMAKVLGIGPPKDYILRIKWSVDTPVQVHLGPHGEVYFSGFIEPLSKVSKM